MRNAAPFLVYVLYAQLWGLALTAEHFFSKALSLMGGMRSLVQHHLKARLMVGEQTLCLRDICPEFLGGNRTGCPRSLLVHGFVSLQ